MLRFRYPFPFRPCSHRPHFPPPPGRPPVGPPPPPPGRPPMGPPPPPQPR